MKPLSLRIAERLVNKSDAPKSDRNRAAFIIHRADIQNAVDNGCSILQIWQTLQEEKLINYGYQAFRRYAHQLCTKPD
ncbi:TraK family protein [Pseudomonas frederiksbergensis]|uniref:TraK family protein n=1 Tax=Pseudomonas frederiksbergensis TaxID=104087 RepID=UPI003D231F73